MRVLIGCLAVFGLVVLLIVVGVLSLRETAISSLTKSIPPYATREELSNRYAADLELIAKAIETRDFSQLKDHVSNNVLAVYRDNDKDFYETEMLSRHATSIRSSHISNQAGIGSLTVNGRTVECVVFVLNAPPGRDDDYMVFILDQQAQQVEQP